MKIYFIFLGFSFLLFQCTNLQIHSTEQKEAIVVDGLAYDWENYPVEYNDEWHMVYGAVHSDSNLYLQFSINDPQLARMMARRGVVLWFNEDKKFGIRYSEKFLKNDFNKFPPNDMYLPKGEFSVVAEDTVLAPDIIEYPAISAKLELYKGLYCFEFAIPLYPETNLSFLKNIFLDRYYFEFELAAVSEKQSMQKRKSAAGRNPGGVSGGMRGGRGGGRSGRAGQRRMPERPMDIEAKEIGFEIILTRE